MTTATTTSRAALDPLYQRSKARIEAEARKPPGERDLPHLSKETGFTVGALRGLVAQAEADLQGKPRAESKLAAATKPKAPTCPTTITDVPDPTPDRAPAEIARHEPAGETDLLTVLDENSTQDDVREFFKRLAKLRRRSRRQREEAREIALNRLAIVPEVLNPEIRVNNALELFGGPPSTWPEPKQLPPERPEAPPLPEELLPAPLRPWCADLAARMQVPLEMIAVPAVVTAAALVGCKVTIHPKRYDDWRVAPNLWGGVVASPGMLKSPALAKAQEPFQALAREALEEFERRSYASSARAEALQAKEAALKGLLRKYHQTSKAQKFEGIVLDAAGLQDRLRALKEEIADAPRPKRYFTNDPTVEKLGELLRDSPRGLLVERDELAGWMALLDRDDRRGDREFYLEGWSGLGEYTVDRILRGTIYIPRNCISIFGGIQPGKLKRYVVAALAGGEGADGLLQRFQVLVWPEFLSDWKHIDRRPDRRAHGAAEAAFRRLDGLPPEHEPRRFSTEAQTLFDDWFGGLERRLRSGDLTDAPAFLAHLAKYRSLMPSLALVFHLLVEPHGREVSLDAAKLAAAWCDFLETHARKVYAPELNTPVLAARALAQRIQKGEIEQRTTVREIYRAGWSGLGTPEEVRAALGVLAECNWVDVESQATGGRSREVVYINPQVVVEEEDGA